jgi:hypothetical protein
MSCVPLSPPRLLLQPPRDVRTARSSIQHLPGHRRRVTIDHQPLVGVTPQTLLRGFRHIGDVITYAGQRTPAHVAWHVSVRNIEEVGHLEHLLPPLVPRLALDVPASAS